MARTSYFTGFPLNQNQSVYVEDVIRQLGELYTDTEEILNTTIDARDQAQAAALSATASENVATTAKDDALVAKQEAQEAAYDAAQERLQAQQAAADAEVSSQAAASSAATATDVLDQVTNLYGDVTEIQDAVTTAVDAKDEAVQVKDAVLYALENAEEIYGDTAALQLAVTQAENARDASQDAKTLAEKWASEAEDVPVVPGQFSAKHWAAKAEAEVESTAKKTANLADLANLKEARSNLGEFATVTDVEASHIPAVLDSIRTNGYYSPGDGGGALYVEGDERPGAIQSGDGRWWELAFGRELNVRQFGAKGDGVTDDHAAFQRCFDAACDLISRDSTHVNVYIPPGHYLISDQITAILTSPLGQPDTSFYNTLNVYGAGVESTQIYPSEDNSGHLFKIQCTQVRHVVRVSDFGVLSLINPKISPDKNNESAIYITSTITQAGTGAEATADISGGSIQSITVTNGGEDYVSSPTVVIVGDGSGAEATATVAEGAVTGVTITNPGSGYTWARVSFKGGGSTGYGFHGKIQAHVENIRIGYSSRTDGVANGAFRYGVKVHHMTKPHLKNIWIMGQDRDNLPNNPMVAGIEVRSCYGPVYDNIRVDGYAENGIYQFGSRTYKPSVEAGDVRNSVFVNTVNGVVFRHNFHPDHGTYYRGEPGISVSGCHFSLLGHCITIDNYSDVRVYENYVYLTREDRAVVDTPSVVRIINSDNVIVEHNQFVGSGYYNTNGDASVCVLIEEADPARIYGNFNITVKENYVRSPGILVKNLDDGEHKLVLNNVIDYDPNASVPSFVLLADLKGKVQTFNNIQHLDSNQLYNSSIIREAPNNSGSGGLFEEFIFSRPDRATVGPHTLRETRLTSYDSEGSEFRAFRTQMQVRNNEAGSLTTALRMEMADGSAAREVMQLRTDPISGQTGLRVLMNVSGVKGVHIVRVGPDGSGPGGNGRALYIE